MNKVAIRAMQRNLIDLLKTFEVVFPENLMHNSTNVMMEPLEEFHQITENYKFSNKFGSLRFGILLVWKYLIKIKFMDSFNQIHPPRLCFFRKHNEIPSENSQSNLLVVVAHTCFADFRVNLNKMVRLTGNIAALVNWYINAIDSHIYIFGTW